MSPYKTRDEVSAPQTTLSSAGVWGCLAAPPHNGHRIAQREGVQLNARLLLDTAYCLFLRSLRYFSYVRPFFLLGSPLRPQQLRLLCRMIGRTLSWKECGTKQSQVSWHTFSAFVCSHAGGNHKNVRQDSRCSDQDSNEASSKIQVRTVTPWANLLRDSWAIISYGKRLVSCVKPHVHLNSIWKLRARFTENTPHLHFKDHTLMPFRETWEFYGTRERPVLCGQNGGTYSYHCAVTECKAIPVTGRGGS
jgi:hypothetical protein